MIDRLISNLVLKRAPAGVSYGWQPLGVIGIPPPEIVGYVTSRLVGRGRGCEGRHTMFLLICACKAPPPLPSCSCCRAAATPPPPLLTFVDGWVDDAKLLACVCVRSCVPACGLVA